MNKPDFNLEHKNVIDSFLLKIPGVVPGKMFGYPAYYINKRLFACIYDSGVGVKIPEKVANDLIGKEGIIYFQPLGRAKMKEWIQINREKSEEYLKDQEIFEKSIKFVSILGSKKKWYLLTDA
ncbi:MAG: hypothetical protein ACP5E9_09320 [Candidatus Methanospirareceae archaeon]